MSLSELSDDLGRKAFKAVSQKVIFGDVEPSHILEEAEKLSHKKTYDGDGVHKWISQAPTFKGVRFREGDLPTQEFNAWLALERPNLYRSIDPLTREIVLIQNPDAWEWVITKKWGFVFKRPDPILTGQMASPEPNRRN